ncbi:UDP-N-acetylmuramoyl-L-alanyl-D-glutamate--2,6-diaminopimelate ligase [Flavobacterium sp. CS20]|uniref:UDP-N-acetylmuramoyl-L-alanyl-D-glutamate--2, 6-diaminopimelate ligase n=1 Tax=Flavobacterium sp. CS20 TaxID=2775246 RepID=UPI001B39D4B0|nr:UDP-N-acetylmuramoyl-L-alanyl-D-glutamate--2,6-diaminopimelate ligase [Flavobacterium sp. CS20]QTY26914.1 UDP-N-acetylmuramoyl-L-alanyl-D-glutamate--2,6-diaminopimelate ligase [Flavobacterium sp. CS20]
MNTLKDILYKVSLEAVEGSTNQSFINLHFDSRKVGLNDIFVAIKGTHSDGHHYIKNAVDQGAIAVVCEEFPELKINGVTYIKVKDSREALAYMASNFFDNPSSKLKLIGVTGTNGKTTVSTLLYQLFLKLGYSVGLISTVRILINDEEFPTRLTTPDSITINQYIHQMYEAGIEYVFMEVSSHGIEQKRSLSLDFDLAIFTNLSHDHLDYHKTFEAYRDVKKRLFDQLKKSAFAITNSDDKNGEFMIQNCKAKTYTYALKSYADYKAKIIENSFSGLHLKINDQDVWTKVIGEFNAYNLLAVYAVANLFKLDELESLKFLSQLQPVEGRFEHFKSQSEDISAIVDYAHTPDALKNVLETINSIRTKNETLITVVGCGGNRDKTKRPKMGQIAAKYSDQVIFTSDNPRDEDPDEIINDIEKGVEPQHQQKILSITNRKEAIKTACKIAKPNDIILIAGKGHETYQEIKGKRKDFDDMEIVKYYLNRFKK